MSNWLASEMNRVNAQLKRVQENLSDGAEKIELFRVRRNLEKALHEHYKQGDRIELRDEFELRCEKCNAIQAREEDYYIHLRKDHRVKETDAIELTNKPREAYEKEIQELRRLLAKYTEADLEDQFTREHNKEMETRAREEYSRHAGSDTEEAGIPAPSPSV